MEKVFASVSSSSPLSVAVARTSQSPFPLHATPPKISFWIKSLFLNLEETESRPKIAKKNWSEFIFYEKKNWKNIENKFDKIFDSFTLIENNFVVKILLKNRKNIDKNFVENNWKINFIENLRIWGLKNRISSKKTAEIWIKTRKRCFVQHYIGKMRVWSLRWNCKIFIRRCFSYCFFI